MTADQYYKLLNDSLMTLAMVFIAGIFFGLLTVAVGATVTKLLHDRTQRIWCKHSHQRVGQVDNDEEDNNSHDHAGKPARDRCELLGNDRNGLNPARQPTTL